MTAFKPIAARPPEIEDRGSGEYVCWSRMQAEAGQMLDSIIARKERERQAGSGLFFWGVGNAPSTAINALARLRMPVPVVFSRMKSKPKAVDVTPSRTVVWRQYVDECGIERPLPLSALVTSRGDSAGGKKTRHYALMCYSEAALSLTRGIPFDPAAFRNVSGAGAPVGASQVTALLKQVAEPDDAPEYEANVIAWLTGGYWVRLSDPRELDARAIADIAHFGGNVDDWMDLICRVRGGGRSRVTNLREENLLL